MADNERPPEQGPADLYTRAQRLNARLASRWEPALAEEAAQVAAALLEHVKSKVEDFDAFVRRVERAEAFPIHESAQVDKGERPLKQLYVRAVDLEETLRQAEARAKKRA